ncbi:glycosyltransferase family 4 protein [Mycobacterium sp. OAE908]|uniref:glycosyltransferase family 4 protein n=1 Tax=Mycobacterium sp. OAE908 TaxID=2817899 RepID=UPI001AE5F4A5
MRSREREEVVFMPPRTLRVLVLDQARGVWGAQRYILRLAPLLRQAGVELVLGGPRSVELHGVWRAAGFVAVDLDLTVDRNIRTEGRPTPSGLANEGRDGVRMARLIADVARAGDYDAIWANAHWTHAEASVAGRICRKPVVLHLHEEAVPGMGQWLRAGAMLLATRTVAVSRGVARSLPAVARNRVTVIQNGVDTEVFSPDSGADRNAFRATLGIGAEDLMVLAATRLDPVKRIEDLINAVRSVDDPRLMLVVAGVTSAFAGYEREVRAIGEELLGSRVIFCGERDDMPDLFRASDVVLHAGVVEGMPLGLLEAQACGTPVVAYAVAGVPEAVRDGVTGLLAPPGDVAALGGALRRVTTDSAVRIEMGRNARAHVLAHHRLQTQAARNVEVLTEMCGVSRAMAG